jgi:hypothetical protein
MKTLLFAFACAGMSLWGQSANRVVPAPGTAPASTPSNKGILSVFSPADPKTTLNARKRFNLYVTNTIGPWAILGESASAGISQARNSPWEWGQGAGAWGHRFGNNMAYNGVRQTISYGVSEMVREDNRYFASNRQTVPGRIGYVLISPVTARRRDGRRAFSISAFSGLVGASTISLAWRPQSMRSGGSVARNFMFSYAGTAGINAVREFVPGIVRHFRK